jgi:hypothetical protein
LFAKARSEVKNGSKPAKPSDQVIPVNENDVKILRRALEILGEESNWNRNDNRECPKKAKKFSLYCALSKASIEINGEFDHRVGALEEVRRTVEGLNKGKVYEHRLMNYNNDPTTKFAHIRNVLEVTLRIISDRLRERSH